MIDFRSDTVTRPGAAMHEAMMRAPVGDDVFGEDPSINELEMRSAAYFGMEAGIFCPSGTMTNQIGIKCHTQPGDEVICDESSHVYQYEGGGIAYNSGASVRLLRGNRGRLTAEQVREAINPDDVHKPVSTLVSLENTCNRGGGACYDLEEIRRIRGVCNEQGLKLHLDGARLCNALVARGDDPKEYGRLFHSISLCFSKGLGCPVGSVLVGDRELIRKARRVRKVLGGGMRQAGYLAAAALYALEHNVDRLQQDHDHARLLAQTLSEQAYVKEVLPVETNIIIFEVAEDRTAAGLVTQMKEKEILAYAITPRQVRLVTHLDLTPDLIDQTLSLLPQF